MGGLLDPSSGSGDVDEDRQGHRPWAEAAVVGQYAGGAVAADQKLVGALRVGGCQVDGRPVLMARAFRTDSAGHLLPAASWAPCVSGRRDPLPLPHSYTFRGPDPTDYAPRLRNASSTAETCRNRPVRREDLRCIHQLRRRSATSELRKQVAELNATVRPVETARFRSIGDKPNRLGRCAATECDTTFADTSPTGRRRYCSQRCASRDVVCRHRARAAVI